MTRSFTSRTMSRRCNQTYQLQMSEVMNATPLSKAMSKQHSIKSSRISAKSTYWSLLLALLTSSRQRIMTSPRWRRTMDVNLDGSFLFACEAGRHMLANKIKGSIILIASMSASICVRPQKQAAYNASKGGVQMLAKSLATEWAPQGIRVSSLSPGVSNVQSPPHETY